MTFLGDSRDAKCCILQYKIVSKLGRVRSPKRRVRDDDFVVGCGRIIIELSSNRLSIGGSIQGVSAEIWRFQIFVAGALFLEVAGVTLLAPRIGNDVSYVTQIRDDIHFCVGRRSIW